MTITLPLQPRDEAKLIAIAQAKGVSTDALVREALDKILADAPDQPAPELDPRPIWEVIADNMKDVPPEDLALLPTDGASQIDHYLYGHQRSVTAVFADTFYWAALTSTEDKDNARAIDFSRSVKPDRIVTTDEVLTEYLAFFPRAKPSIPLQAGDNVEVLIRSSAVIVVPQSRHSFLAGLELYRLRPDKGYSLTDCISMQAMRRQGITQVLTNDFHFAQEGFHALFRES